MINAWAFLNYWGHVPGLPPKSTPMATLEALHVSSYGIYLISESKPFLKSKSHTKTASSYNRHVLLLSICQFIQNSSRYEEKGLKKARSRARKNLSSVGKHRLNLL